MLATLLQINWWWWWWRYIRLPYTELPKCLLLIRLIHRVNFMLRKLLNIGPLNYIVDCTSDTSFNRQLNTFCFWHWWTRLYTASCQIFNTALTQHNEGLPFSALSLFLDLNTSVEEFLLASFVSVSTIWRTMRTKLSFYCQQIQLKHKQ